MIGCHAKLPIPKERRHHKGILVVFRKFLSAIFSSPFSNASQAFVAHLLVLLTPFGTICPTSVEPQSPDTSRYYMLVVVADGWRLNLRTISTYIPKYAPKFHIIWITWPKASTVFSSPPIPLAIAILKAPRPRSVPRSAPSPGELVVSSA